MRLGDTLLHRHDRGSMLGGLVPTGQLQHLRDVLLVALALRRELLVQVHLAITQAPVSYTHLDVYKRQGRILAEHAKANGWRIVGVLNNDMIGNSSGIDGITDRHTARVFSEGTRADETPEEARQRRFTGGEVDSPSRNLARYIKTLARHVPELDVMLVYRLDRFGRGGHHRPFNDAGYPAVRVMETHEHYDRQHQDLRVETQADGSRRVYGDTIDGVDFPYAARLTALDAVTLAAVAAAPPPPAAVKIEGAVSADTTLTWQRPSGTQAEGLAGYRIYLSLIHI